MPLQRSSFKRASRSHAKTGCFLCVFSLCFLGSVSEGFFEFFQFSGAFGGPKGGHFWATFVKQLVFSEKVAPSFFAHLYMVWLDFEGLGLPGGSKNEKKRHLGNHGFLN